eukprot:scaffold103492_cov19-Tisochrysis_lutea.AAC.1
MAGKEDCLGRAHSSCACTHWQVGVRCICTCDNALALVDNAMPQVGPGEVDDELEEEVGVECTKYGAVTDVMIFEVTAPGYPSEEAVRIFVQASSSNSDEPQTIPAPKRFRLLALAPLDCAHWHHVDDVTDTSSDNTGDSTPYTTFLVRLMLSLPNQYPSCTLAIILAQCHCKQDVQRRCSLALSLLKLRFSLGQLERLPHSRVESCHCLTMEQCICLVALECSALLARWWAVPHAQLCLHMDWERNITKAVKSTSNIKEGIITVAAPVKLGRKKTAVPSSKDRGLPKEEAPPLQCEHTGKIVCDRQWLHVTWGPQHHPSFLLPLSC